MSQPAPFTALAIDAVEPAPSAPEWLPLRHRLGIASFGVNAFVADAAGDELIERHDEAGTGHEELYVVLRGHARFEAGGREHDAPAGTLVHVAPGTERRAEALAPGTTVLAVGATPGEAFTVSDWERRALEA